MIDNIKRCRCRRRLRHKTLLAVVQFLILSVLLIFCNGSSEQQQQQQQQPNDVEGHSNSNHRSLQSNNNCINTAYNQDAPLNSPPDVISRVLAHLDAHEESIQSIILQSYTNRNRTETRDSIQWTYTHFRSALQYMATTGVTIPSTVAQQINVPLTDTKLRFFLGHSNCRNDGWHLGLANVAAFLSQSMTLAIIDDACDELNTEKVADEWVNWDEGAFPISNSCGQGRADYSTYMSDNDFCENVYQCEVDVNMQKTAEPNHYQTQQNSIFTPPMQCYPRTVNEPYTGYFDPREGGSVIISKSRAVPNSNGRTDIEGCCWWGRGALHTRGTCGMGKFNYYFGTKAARDGRPSRYPDIDFCKSPESICKSNNARSMEMRWILAMFEWVDRVQNFNSDSNEDENGEGGWNYIQRSVKFLENFGKTNFIDLEDTHFIDEVGSVLDQGCPNPPCDIRHPRNVPQAQNRKLNYVSVAKAVGLPVKSPAMRVMEQQLNTYKTGIEDVLLRSTSPVDGTSRNSYRYRFFDFMKGLELVTDVGVENSYFYIGQEDLGNAGRGANMGDIKSGVFNVALFLTQAIVNSIKDDGCDEHNTQMVNGRHPVSNSCGQYGISYQDLVCTEAGDIGKECPLDPSMTFTAATRALDHRAPQAFHCAPQTQFPFSGFWDADNMEEINDTAFANQLGRTNVEACCWWGRGVFRHVNHGRCFFGRLNHAIGKRAALDGRPSLYPDVDFCKSPEKVCSSQYSNELQWVVGMYHWIKVIQPYNENGWSFMDNLRQLPSDITDIRFSQMLSAVDCIMKTGNHRCNVAVDSRDTLKEVLTVITDERIDPNAPTNPPTFTSMPSVSPTDFPTVKPTLQPTGSPTSSSAPSASPNIFEYPSPENIEAIVAEIQKQSQTFISTVFPSESTGELYTFNSFIETLLDMAGGSVEGKYFYVGHGKTTNRNIRKRGMVNIAAFLAHARTNGFQNNACDEKNVDFVIPDGTVRKYAISNSCGQYGDSYQDMRCDADESFMECAPDPSMLISAVPSTDDTSYKKPPAFFCGPKAYFPYTGYFEAESVTIVNDEPFPNRIGRTNVEACCWWGRGSTQVKGVCMYGKLNYYIGARAREEGRKSMFPDIDFCKRPQEICSGQYSTRLTWATGMINWIENIQSNLDYSDYLDRIVSGEMERADFVGFISDMLDRGKNKPQRLANFDLIIDSLTVAIK